MEVRVLYDVEITCGSYEDKYESHRLFSTLEKAREYANTPVKVYEDFDIPGSVCIWEVGIDYDYKEYIEDFKPKWVYA